MAKAKKTTQAKRDISTLDATELKHEIVAARKEHYVLSMKHSLGELKQPHLIRKSRKNIAQLSTALSSISL